jgi:lipoate-protein ligase A
MKRLPTAWPSHATIAIMHFLDLTLSDPPSNLALDEALLLDAETAAGGEILRVWHWPFPVVVLGSGCKLADDVNEAACHADDVPILRRSSGGGTVLWGDGCLFFSLVLSYERAPELTEVRSSYRYILGRVAAALQVDGVRHEGISDLALDGRKVSGNAQQRKRSFLLHHGTVLYDFDAALVGRYLRPPPRQPEYRAQRAHEDFLANLRLTAAEIKARLRNAWGADAEQTTWPEETVRRLCAEKYTQDDWTRRR